MKFLLSEVTLLSDIVHNTYRFCIVRIVYMTKVYVLRTKWLRTVPTSNENPLLGKCTYCVPFMKKCTYWVRQMAARGRDAVRVVSHRTTFSHPIWKDKLYIVKMVRNSEITQKMRKYISLFKSQAQEMDTRLIVRFTW